MITLSCDDKTEVCSNRVDTQSEWRKKIGGRCVNKHHQLFWLEKNGPKVILHVIRLLLLGSVILMTIVVFVYREDLVCNGGRPDVGKL